MEESVINKNMNKNNIKFYLKLAGGLLLFFTCIIIYIKYTKRKKDSKFTAVELPNIDNTVNNNEEINNNVKNVNVNVYETEDTRMGNPLSIPANPIVRKRIKQTVLPASSELYSNQPYNTPYYLLDTPPAQNTNQLIYSGGETTIIKSPLQFNYPYDEQLRSQDIMITPYNRIKYGDARNC